MLAVAFVAICTLLRFPGDTWLAELFVSVQLYTLLAAVIALFACCILRMWRFVVLSALLCSANVCNLFFWNCPAPDSTLSSNLRVVQVNVENKNTKMEPLITFIRSVKPDVFAVEELTSEWDQSLRSALPEYDAFTLPRKDYFGIGIFSKLPFRKKDSFVPVGVKPEEPALFAELDVSGKRVRVVAAHTFAPHRPDEMRRRNEQLNQLAKKISPRKSPVILLGDLNTVPWSAACQQFLSKSALSDTRMPYEFTNTCCVKNLIWVPIDYCLISPEIQSVRVRTGPDINSDHVPLWVDLVL